VLCSFIELQEWRRRTRQRYGSHRPTLCQNNLSLCKATLFYDVSSECPANGGRCIAHLTTLLIGRVADSQEWGKLDILQHSAISTSVERKRGLCGGLVSRTLSPFQQRRLQSK